MANYIGAIDQGTTSTRFIVFDRSGPHRFGGAEGTRADLSAARVGGARRERDLAAHARGDRAMRWSSARWWPSDLAAIGITNQRETTVVWDRQSGAPVYNALVWQDTRTAEAVAELARNGGSDRFRAKTGLPLATYFSALKIRWILDNVPGARARAEARRPAVRQHRHVRPVESHRRAARHRLHQCQPHAVDEPGDAGLGRGTAGRVPAFRGPCCRASRRAARCTARLRWSA